MADVIVSVCICFVRLSCLISCYYLISTVRYQNKSYKLCYWICHITSENPGLNSTNLCLQVSMVPNGRLLTQGKGNNIFDFQKRIIMVKITQNYKEE